MPSSISSFESAERGAAVDRGRWRRFFLVTIAAAVGLGVSVFAFIAIVDPWDVLPLSPGWQRAPMSSNQRYSFVALARNPRFDSAVIGTSTSRLLRPAALDAGFGGTFVNLSMNAATPYEQSRMLALFAQAHPSIHSVVIALNYGQWCTTDAFIPKYTYNNFPEWMHGRHKWRSYGHIFSLYAVQEAFAQLAYLIGLRPPRFGFDGYANFLPDDGRYNAARAADSLGKVPPRGPVTDELRDQPGVRFPALETMRAMLSGLPVRTAKIVFFAPTFLGNRPAPGSEDAAPLVACKFRIVEIARQMSNTKVVDFLIDSPITRVATNYWDHLHYRVAIAERLVVDLVRAVTEGEAPSADYRVLLR